MDNSQGKALQNYENLVTQEEYQVLRKRKVEEIEQLNTQIVNLNLKLECEFENDQMGESSSPITKRPKLQEVEAVKDVIFIKRPGCTNMGLEYEKIFIASLTLYLTTDSRITDFQLSANDANFDLFDDVVVEIQTVDNTIERYAFQLKYGASNKTINTTEFTKDKGHFSVKRYYESFKKYLLKLDQFKLVLLTNRPFKIDDSATLDCDIKVIKCHETNVIQNFLKSSCYKFQSSGEYQEFFENFYLYTDQQNFNKIIKDTSQKFQELFSCHEYIFNEYVNFINVWHMQEGKKEKLNKTFVKEALILKLLSPFIHPILLGPIIKPRVEEKLLFEAICEFDVTIVETEQVEIAKTLLTHCESTNSTDDKTIAKKYQIDSSVPENTAKIYWLLNRTPLIVSHHETVIKAINFRTEGKKFIITGNSTGKFDPFCKIFRNLLDLKIHSFTIYEKILQTFQCSFQGKEIDLKTLIRGCELEEMLTLRELLLMMTKSFSIGGEKEVLPEFYIERTLSKPIIDYKLLESLAPDTTIILSRFTQTGKLWETITIEDFFLVRETRIKIITSEDDCSQNIFDKVCQKLLNTNIMKVHQFRLDSDNSMEWVRSKGDIKDLKNFLVQGIILERDWFNCGLDNNKINVICGEPGIGKSTFMKNLMNNLPPINWAIMINPKDHSKFLREQGPDVKKFLEHIAKIICENQLESRFLAVMIKQTRINFIWDGLDEVSETTLNIVLSLIEKLSQKEINQWITSRNHLKSLLEERFSVLATTIQEFNEDSQQQYIKSRLMLDDNNSKDVFNKIKNNLKVLKNNQILGVPLQIYMFTELFRENLVKYNNFFNEGLMSITDLYKYFVDEKFNRYFQEKLAVNLEIDRQLELMDQMKEKKLKFYEKIAKNLYLRSDKTRKKLPTSGDHIGILIGDNFVHNSYGEYFAACYLTKNLHKMIEYSEVIFKKEYENIRFMFDNILARDSPAHLAVLYKNFQRVQCCTEIQQKDSGGRSILHLASSWGNNYPKLPSIKINKNEFEVLDVKYFDKEPLKQNSDYEKLLRHLMQLELNPYDTDKIFNFTAFDYADKASCFLPLALLSKQYRFNVNNLQIFSDPPTILYYSIVYDIPNLFYNFNGSVPFVFNSELGKNFLDFAIQCGSLNCLKLLIDKNEKYRNELNKNFNKLISNATKSGYIEIVKFLLGLDCHDNVNNPTLLINACKLGRRKIVELLVDKGCDINATNKYERGALSYACERGHFEIVKYLIDRGSKMNVRDIYGKTLLSYACDIGNLDIVKFLLDRGCDVNVADEDGQTPLICVTKNDYLDLVKFLVENNSDINAKDWNDRTPISYASEMGYMEIVKYLVEQNCGVNIQDVYGKSPLSYACEKGRLEIVKYLTEHGCEINIKDENHRTPFTYACEQGNKDIVKYLITRGSDVNVQDEYGRIPLSYVCDSHFDIVKLLIDRGCDTNVKDCYGRTPLSYACEKGQIEVVKYLIEQGSDVNIKDHYNRTPLTYASDKGNFEIVKFLVESGSNPITRIDYNLNNT